MGMVKIEEALKDLAIKSVIWRYIWDNVKLYIIIIIKTL